MCPRHEDLLQGLRSTSDLINGLNTELLERREKNGSLIHTCRERIKFSTPHSGDNRSKSAATGSSGLSVIEPTNPTALDAVTD